MRGRRARALSLMLKASASQLLLSLVLGGLGKDSDLITGCQKTLEKFLGGESGQAA